MVAMTAVLVLGVIALFVAIVAWVTWRRGADERQSVQHHQHTLETLRHVADRRQQSVRLAPGRRDPSSPGSPASRPSARGPVHDIEGGPHRSGPRAPAQRGTTPTRRGPAPPPRGKVSPKVLARRRETTVVHDEGPREDNGISAPISPSAARRMGGQLPGAAEQARRAARARVRRTRLASGVAVLAIGGVVGGVVASRPSHNPPRAGPPRASPRSHPITGAGHGPVVTATTAGSSALAPTAPTAFSAQYVAPSSAYTVVIDASEPCWVMATDSATGHVVWTGTIDPGQSRSLAVSGGLTVELGAPSVVSVTLDGQRVQFPTGFRAPFSLSLQAAS